VHLTKTKRRSRLHNVLRLVFYGCAVPLGWRVGGLENGVASNLTRLRPGLISTEPRVRSTASVCPIMPGPDQRCVASRQPGSPPGTAGFRCIEEGGRGVGSGTILFRVLRGAFLWHRRMYYVGHSRRMCSTICGSAPQWHAIVSSGRRDGSVFWRKRMAYSPVKVRPVTCDEPEEHGHGRSCCLDCVGCARFFELAGLFHPAVLVDAENGVKSTIR
jgi:hypothetical protein